MEFAAAVGFTADGVGAGEGVPEVAGGAGAFAHFAGPLDAFLEIEMEEALNRAQGFEGCMARTALGPGAMPPHLGSHQRSESSSGLGAQLAGGSGLWITLGCPFVDIAGKGLADLPGGRGARTGRGGNGFLWKIIGQVGCQVFREPAVDGEADAFPVDVDGVVAGLLGAELALEGGLVRGVEEVGGRPFGGAAPLAGDRQGDGSVDAHGSGSTGILGSEPLLDQLGLFEHLAHGDLDLFSQVCRCPIRIDQGLEGVLFGVGLPGGAPLEDHGDLVGAI